VRVVHLSTYDADGGAARAAFRTHEALLASGQQSAMLVRTKRSCCKSIKAVAAPGNADTFFGDLVQKHYIDGNRTGVSTTFFSLGWPAEDLSRHPRLDDSAGKPAHIVGLPMYSAN